MMNRRNFGLSLATGFGAMAIPAGADTVPASELGVSFNVIYPNHEGARFDVEYYRDSHIPLVMKVMKADSVTLIKGVARGAVMAPYAMIAHFQFTSSDALDKALANPAMAEVRADVARFTDIKPVIMFGKSL